ncbi:MAG: hypothetical protein J5791_05305 [Fibrobacter sp.]|nr:hypothetical protein [Fibrobacter sp.]
MKKWLFVEFLFALSLLVACGDDESSSPAIDEPEETSSSSSEEKSSSSVDNGCEVVPFYQEGWPTDLGYLSALKNFYAYGSDVGCSINMEKAEATLYRWKDISSDSSVLEKIGSVPITTTLKSGKSDSSGAERWDNVWEYTTDMSSLDNPALPDGRYRLAWEEGFNVNFYLARTFPKMEWTVNVKNEYAQVNYDTSSIGDFRAKVYLYDSARTNAVPVECSKYLGYVNCKVSGILDTIKEGHYVISMNAVRLSASDREFYNAVKETWWGNDSLLWALALDSAGNFREGIAGKRFDSDVFIDRTAPKVVKINTAKYSVKSNGTQNERKYSFDLDAYENLIGRKSQILKVSFRVYGKLAYQDYVKQEKDSLHLTYEFSYTDSNKRHSVDVILSDAEGNSDTLDIESLAVVDSQHVDGSLDKPLASIPAVKYDCSKYKCVTTAYLNPDVEYGELLDERDNQVYRTVKIGDQEWMAQNLNFAVDSSFCDTRDSNFCDRAGRLYTWNAAVGKSMEECSYEDDCDFSKDSIKAISRIRGVCPEGWHMPSFDDFYTLKTTVAELYPEKFDLMGSRLMKSQNGWNEGLATNETGFSVVPSKGWTINQESAAFWIAEVHLVYDDNPNFHTSQYSHKENIYIEFTARDDEFPKFRTQTKSNHFSVRCLKN